jgi:hypothetical protein
MAVLPVRHSQLTPELNVDLWYSRLGLLGWQSTLCGVEMNLIVILEVS